MEELLSASRSSLALSPEGLHLYLPATFGYKLLAEDFTSLQEVLITEPGGHERYPDRHAMGSDKCRYIDDRHMETLCRVSEKTNQYRNNNNKSTRRP